MTTTTTHPELKARHRAMWAAGDYARIADELVPDVGRAVADACWIAPGERVLDIGAGTGNAAIPAALAGGVVTASDLTPELLEIGRRRAAEAGLEITWETADAEALPYDDASFDVVLSAIGVMFAPFHRAAAEELLRVTRPGGRIGVASWTPAGFIGQMFAAMKPFAPAPPEGAQPPPLWGEESHVRWLFGDRVRGLRAERRALVVDAFTTGAAFRDAFKASYGPTLVAYRSLGGDAERIAALDRVLADLGDRHLDEGRMSWEYLVVTAQRA
ncbi:class I SAM-dependent methyltransferase [Nocardioides sp. BP30]|uniref:class I SAM-dependent methyltransferase n=1 Tax=Nocardioides sp. BP30 TaxID=3036374 RepID=UPI0024691979|nr:class I SAM-dependent methyltransferase [Nocardioides sp. BP30]WGL53290.1 class I SAM-dependent methyltransferase [Nocardioides sp. BP30]